MSAGFASLASQAAVSLISNQGDLSKVVKEITSSQALRSLATSMVTAGLIAGATELVNGVTSAAEGTASATTQGMAQSTTQSATQSTASLGNAVKATSKAFDIGERIQAGLIRASSETLVNSTIGGESFEESVLAAARSGIANIAGGFFAHEWGLKYKDVDSQIDYFTHKLIHGIIGAGMGAISDGEALAGAIGAVVGEVVGETYANAHPEGFNPSAEDYDPSLRESLKNRGKILTQISAALAAAFLGENPNVAACTALNAVTENSFHYVAPVAVGLAAYAAYRHSDYETPEEAVRDLMGMLGDGLTPIIGDKNAAAVSAKVKHYLDNALKTATAGSDTDKITKDLYHILNGSVGAIDHRAESFRDAMPKFSPLLGDLAFCVGAACGTVEAVSGKGRFKSKKKGRTKSAQEKKVVSSSSHEKLDSKNRAQHERYKSELTQEEAKKEASATTKKEAKGTVKKEGKPFGKRISDMSDSEFTSEIAKRADRKFAGKGPMVGTKKHQYAKDFVRNVQERRARKTELELEKRYKGGEEYRSGMGTKGSVIPDVYNPKTGLVYDYKFGSAKVTGRQRQNLERQMPRGEKYKGVIEVKPPNTGNPG